MEISKHSNIGRLVADNYSLASVFKDAGIDFCCQGNRTVAEACEEAAIDIKELLDGLKSVGNKKENNIDYQSWPIDLLCDYIEKKHHRFVAQKIQEITPYLDKVVQVHGQKHPELFAIKELFQQSVGELTAHMKKEELVLFPFIRKMCQSIMAHQAVERPVFGTVQNPVHMMVHEHNLEGDRFRRISELSNNYMPPLNACNTYKVTYSLLKEFEDDLHKHIHLENNILFPKAIALEQQMKKHGSD